MLVRRMKLLPLRVVCRNIAAGRAAERMALSEGEVLPFPIIEFHIDDNAVRALSQDAEQIQIATEISEGEVSILRAKTVEINCLLKDFFEEKELVLVDFSLVFGRDDSNRIRVGDEISPDTCRLWDRTTHEKLDKDRFRRDMAGAESAYREVLKRVTGETV